MGSIRNRTKNNAPDPVIPEKILMGELHPVRAGKAEMLSFREQWLPGIVEKGIKRKIHG
jgi:hypothetical protein